MLTFLKKTTALPTELHFGEQRIRLVVRRNSRAKRICLRVNTKDQAIHLTLPPRAPLKHAMAFLKKKQAWLHHIVETLPAPILLEDKAIIPLLGEKRQILWEEATKFSYQLTENALHVYGKKEKKSEHIFKAVKEVFRDYINQKAPNMASHIRKSITRLSIRDPRTRWGSCAANGNLSFSWRLSFAPIEVLNYVICHEVAHLQYMHHRAEFWDLVAQLCPSYEPHCRWLKTHGHTLFRYSPAPSLATHEMD